MTTSPTTLRGGAIVRLPFILLALLFGSLAMWIALWGAWNPEHLGVAFWSQLITCGAISILFFIAAAGCHVRVKDGTITDYVAWIPRRRIAQEDITAARVRMGPWRFFEVTTSRNGSFLLTGAGPQQFPSRLREGAMDSDFNSLDVLMGTPVER